MTCVAMTDCCTKADGVRFIYVLWIATNAECRTLCRLHPMLLMRIPVRTGRVHGGTVVGMSLFASTDGCTRASSEFGFVAGSGSSLALTAPTSQPPKASRVSRVSVGIEDSGYKKSFCFRLPVEGGVGTKVLGTKDAFSAFASFALLKSYGRFLAEHARA